MSRKFIYFCLTAVIVVGLGMAGCRGKTGPAGPQGEKGDPGTPAVDKGSISGRVTDPSGTAIEGATVETSPATSSATTDSSGAFTISNVPIGVYSVIARKSGYVVYTLSGVGVAAGGTTLVSLVLTPESPWVREQSPGV